MITEEIIIETLEFTKTQIDFLITSLKKETISDGLSGALQDYAQGGEFTAIDFGKILKMSFKKLLESKGEI